MSAFKKVLDGPVASRSEVGGNYKWWVLFLLTVAYLFNFLDRQILAILQESIKHDLGLSDTQLGLVSGIAFAIFYVTLGIPIARLADKYSRKRIISIAVCVWSLMTALCGLAVNFATLALARVGVGIGEAGCSPPAHSLISDMFSQKQRATALSLYSLGVPIGVMIGFMAGGWLNDTFGWRVAFVVVGAPGLLVGLLVAIFMKEPPRGFADGLDVPGKKAPSAVSLLEAVRILTRKKTFNHIAMASALHGLVSVGLGQWIPSFYIRVHGFTTTEIGIYLAFGAGVIGGASMLLGGMGADRLAQRDIRWYAWWPALSVILLMPFLLAALWVDNGLVSVSLYVVPLLLNSFYAGPTYAITQGLAGPAMRAVASAIILLVLNLIGMGLGPLVVGVVSDLLAPTFGVESLRYALMIATIANIWSFAHYMLAARYIASEMANPAS